jgi:hypothetical protein
MTAKRFFLPPATFLALLLALSLSLTGCGALSTLNIVVTATEAAIPILQAAGVPIPPQVPAYVADVAQCISANGSTANPTTAQLAAISGCLAGLVAPTLTGLPAAIVSIIGQVAKDVAQYLAQVPPPGKGGSTSTKAHVALSTASAAQLQGFAKRSAAVVEKCHTLWPTTPAKR